MDRKLTINKVLLTYLIFLISWSIRVALLNSYINENYYLWSKELINGVIKTIVWFGFAYYFVKKYDTGLKINFKEMFSNKINKKVFFSILIAFIAYYIVAMLIMHGGFAFNPNFHPSQLIGKFLIVGILEEFLFRGWFYNSLLDNLSEHRANIVSSLLFVLIHYPGYIMNGTFHFPLIIYISTFIFVLSLIFGWSFRKSKSLWVPIILHMIWDVLSIACFL